MYLTPFISLQYGAFHLLLRIVYLSHAICFTDWECTFEFGRIFLWNWIQSYVLLFSLSFIIEKISLYARCCHRIELFWELLTLSLASLSIVFFFVVYFFETLLNFSVKLKNSQHSQGFTGSRVILTNDWWSSYWSKRKYSFYSQMSSIVTPRVANLN